MSVEPDDKGQKVNVAVSRVYLVGTEILPNSSLPRVFQFARDKRESISSILLQCDRSIKRLERKKIKLTASSFHFAM